ncbi:muscle-specific protein 20 isoform X3 [Daphnia magna]|nr:muscle-specific protein 20 isoform X3 [Daphnia magna]
MSRETAPQTDQRRKSSQQRFPVESFSSHIQTGVEELHIIVACAFKQKKNTPCNSRISISCLRQSLVCTSVHQDSAPFAVKINVFSFNGLIILPHLHNMAGRPRWQALGKREPEQEREAQAWIESITGERFPEGVSYEDALQDGVILCKLMNIISPGSINKINPSGAGHFKICENLNKFQEACKKYGVPESDIFQTIDLSEKKDIAMVTSTIFGLGSATYKHPEWQGPSLGPKPSEKNQRNFSEEQLKAGQTVIGLQAGTNKGATQAGLNMGASRKILLGK